MTEDDYLERWTRIQPSEEEAVYFSGPPGCCDLCQRPIYRADSFCDCELPDRGGSWGTICVVCAATLKIEPAWGSCQLYCPVESATSSTWVLVAGGQPDDVANDPLS